MDLMKLRVGFLGFRVQSGNGVGDLASVLVAVGMPGGRNACAGLLHSALFYLEVPHSQHLHIYICVYIYIYDFLYIYIYIYTHMVVSANGGTPILAQNYNNPYYGTPYRDPSFSVSRNSYETLPNPSFHFMFHVVFYLILHQKGKTWGPAWTTYHTREYIYIYVCVYMFVYIHIYIYMYLITYIHMQFIQVVISP